MNDFDLLRPAACQRTSNGRRRPGRRRIAYTLTSNLFTFAPVSRRGPRWEDVPVEMCFVIVLFFPNGLPGVQASVWAREGDSSRWASAWSSRVLAFCPRV